MEAAYVCGSGVSLIVVWRDCVSTSVLTGFTQPGSIHLGAWLQNVLFIGYLSLPRQVSCQFHPSMSVFEGTTLLLKIFCNIRVTFPPACQPVSQQPLSLFSSSMNSFHLGVVYCVDKGTDLSNDTLMALVKLKDTHTKKNISTLFFHKGSSIGQILRVRRWLVSLERWL